MNKQWFRFVWSNGDELTVDLNELDIVAIGTGKIIHPTSQVNGGLIAEIPRKTPYWVDFKTGTFVNLTESCYKELLRLLVRGF